MPWKIKITLILHRENEHSWLQSDINHMEIKQECFYIERDQANLSKQKQYIILLLRNCDPLHPNKD